MIVRRNSEDAQHYLGEKRRSSSTSDNGGGDSDSESESSRPPNKRAISNPTQGYDPRVDALIDHVINLANYLQNVINTFNNAAMPTKVLPSTSTDFLVQPITGELDSGEIQTSTGSTKVIKNAPQNHLDALMKLQHFNTDE